MEQANMLKFYVFDRLFLIRFLNTRIPKVYPGLKEEFKRVSTVLDTEEGNKNGIDNDYNGRPEVNLSALARRRALIWHDKDEHQEGKGKQTVCKRR
jgi:hypothetical protein